MSFVHLVVVCLEDVKEVVMPTPVKAMLASYLIDKVSECE